jgi:hypothetical protein
METEAITTTRRPHLRKLMWGALIASPFLFLLAWRGYEWYLDRDLREAIAEADRLDPGWRLMDLEAARAEVSDEENAALQVLAAKKLLPAGWFPPPPGGTSLERELDELPLSIRMNDELQKQVGAALGKASAAVTVARKVAEMPRGRYVVIGSSNRGRYWLPHVQEAHDIAWLLQLDALRRADAGDIDGAFTSCRAILNVGRSIGDEPIAVSQMARAGCQRLSIRSLERALAQGEASASALEAVQHLLEDEDEQPLMLMAARAERAFIHQILEVLEARKLDRTSWGLRSRTGSYQVDDVLDSGKARSCHAEYLRYLTEFVEIAKLPPEQQVEGLRNFDRTPPLNVPPFLAGITEGGDLKKMASHFRHRLAFLRCAVEAVAIERYRLAIHHWPERLEDLVPQYLGKVPTAPFDGQPLRYRRLADGVIIYTVGEDQQDDGGQRVLIRAGKPDRDIGFQLWNPDRRRQAPRQE